MKLNKTIIFNYIGEKLLKLHDFIENKINSIVLYKKNDLKTSKRKIPASSIMASKSANRSA